MKKVQAEHGIICRLPQDPFGYFGWPSIARQADGTLVAACSGLRAAHVCPWGKTVLFTSQDHGRTWSEPEIVNDSLIDDRDAGIVSLGSQRLLLSWFTSDTRFYRKNDDWIRRDMGQALYEQYIAKIESWTDSEVGDCLGSWVRLSEDGHTWGDRISVPLTTPHGPILLPGGDLLYFGKAVVNGLNYHRYHHSGGIQAALSQDGGRNWTILGTVPLPEDTEPDNYHEPHLVALPSGRLIGHIRYQHSARVKNHEPFTIFQTESDDGGRTWTTARPTGAPGSPPHLLYHSSGSVVCVYGHRQQPYGEQAMISRDDCATWEQGIILRDDGVDGDLGYPASVELDDGSILTIYYQKYKEGEKPSLLWTRWSLPD